MSFCTVRDWRFVRQFPLQDGGSRFSCPSCQIASRSGLELTSVIHQSYYFLGEIWYVDTSYRTMLCEGQMICDHLSDDFRSKIAETDVLARLVGLLQDQDSDVDQSSIEIIEAITALANFGWLINHFVLCGDWWPRREIPLHDDWNRCC